MESDEECDACAALILAAATIEAEEQQNRLSVDAADQASLMFSSVEGK